MLINADVKSLELVTAAYLSRDPVMMRELVTVANVMKNYPGDKKKLDEVDLHSLNQSAFKLPERRIAKIFIFRLIYGGSAISYTLDSKFNWISKSVPYWQGVIDRTYDKYQGLHRWHTHLMQTVTTTGKLTLPTGREYYFKPYHNHYKGLQWPRTKILNYPVQGLGAELVALIRVLVRRRLMNEDPSTLMISSVHDSVVLDSLRKFLYNNMVMLKDCVESTPVFFKNTFGTAFDIPLMCEIQYGPNKYNMEEWNGETP